MKPAMSILFICISNRLAATMADSQYWEVASERAIEGWGLLPG